MLLALAFFYFLFFQSPSGLYTVGVCVGGLFLGGVGFMCALLDVLFWGMHGPLFVGRAILCVLLWEGVGSEDMHWRYERGHAMGI